MRAHRVLRAALPVHSYFDFLVFDSHTALIHDYGSDPVGYQTGGWLTHCPKTLHALADIATDLRARGEPVRPLEDIPARSRACHGGAMTGRMRRALPMGLAIIARFLVVVLCTLVPVLLLFRLEEGELSCWSDIGQPISPVAVFFSGVAFLGIAVALLMQGRELRNQRES